MDLVRTIIKNKTTCIFVSPHFDDAVFSAGGLLSELSGKVDLTVINVFTSAGDGKNTLSAKAYLKQIGVTDAKKLYVEREAEDAKALLEVKAKIYNLNYPEALWRKKQTNGIRRVLANRLPEIDRVYPTYKFDIAKGKLKKEDLKLMSEIGRKIKQIIGKTENVLVFCPAGFGQHIDHILTRDICRKIYKDNLIYWADVPYVFSEKNLDFVKTRTLKTYTLGISSKNKSRLAKIYTSQISQVIPDTALLSKPETYYTKMMLPKVKVKKPTVSVAIPAYNEEQNIESILLALLKQKTETCTLKKIIVYSDAGSDNTVLLVEKLMKRHKIITLVKAKERKGKYFRVNQAFRACKTDALVVLDADIILVGGDFLDDLVGVLFTDPKAQLVAAHQVLIKPDSFKEKVIYTNFVLWDNVRWSIPDYLSARNYYGAATAYRGSFVRSVHIPPHLSDPHLYIYLAAAKRNGFRYCYNARTWQWPIATFSDFNKFMNRSIGKEDHDLERIFGPEVNSVYAVGRKYLLAGILKTFIQEPIHFIPAFLLIPYTNIKIKFNRSTSASPVWNILSSTKREAHKTHRVRKVSIK